MERIVFRNEDDDRVRWGIAPQEWIAGYFRKPPRDTTIAAVAEEVVVINSIWHQRESVHNQD